MLYRFGPFVADRVVYRVSRSGIALELTPKLLDLLFYLLDRPAVLVTKEDLLGGVWPGANVTDNALAQAISELRDALDDTPASPTYILTIARRGYRFIAPVTADHAAQAAPTTARTAAPAPSGDTRGIGVLDFVNLSGDADVDWLAAGIAETVTNDLAALRIFRVIDRWRIVAATRLAGPALHDIATQLGLPLLVTGSYQRSHGHLRITARVVDVERGEAIADAKLDGSLDDLFALQDGIVEAFARELGVGASLAGRIRPRETSSLDAYRAATEGWLKIETLDTGLVDASIADFEQAIALDPSYAAAYTGLATAKSIAYETTRTARDPNTDALRSGIEHVTRAIRLDEHLAEAHSTLSFLLTSTLAFDEARAAAHRAVTLEPDNWRHYYRLGHASWGAPRLHALERALALYPQFAYATFEIAMLLVARGDLDNAERLARQGALAQDQRAGSGFRFPAIGFHWLLGAIEAVGGRYPAAIRSFERELRQADARRMYGPEYAAAALVGRGFAELGLDRASDAVASFRAAATHVPGLIRAQIGEGHALDRLGRPAEARAAWAAAAESREHLSASGRVQGALLATAGERALRGETTGALACLESFLNESRPSRVGWQIPIDPAYGPLREMAGWTKIVAALGERAR